MIEYGFRAPRPLSDAGLATLDLAAMAAFVLAWALPALIHSSAWLAADGSPVANGPDHDGGLPSSRPQTWPPRNTAEAMPPRDLLDPAVMAAVLIAAGVEWLRFRHGRFLAAGPLYILLMSAAAYLPRAAATLARRLRLTESRWHWLGLLAASYGLLCLLGSGLLMLPVASQASTSADYKPLYYNDALFVAISAACDTGLPYRDIGVHFTPFGQAVILLLVQAGGLAVLLLGGSIVTFLFHRPARGMGVPPMDPASAAGVSPADWGGEKARHDDLAHALKRTAKFTLVAAVVLEFIGIVLLTPMFAAMPSPRGPMPSPLGALWQATFHSVSSFCGAGFSLYSNNLMFGVGREDGVRPLRDHWQIMGVIVPLVVLGGLGTPVLADLYDWLRGLARRLLGRPATASRGGEKGSGTFFDSSRVAGVSPARGMGVPPMGPERGMGVPPMGPERGMGVPPMGPESVPAVPPAETAENSEATMPSQPATRNIPPPGLSLHSRVVLYATAYIILFGTAGLLLLELSSNQGGVGSERHSTVNKTAGDWAAMSFRRRTREALVQTVLARNTGFRTIDLNQLSDGSKLWLCGLMTVGGNPGGTGGGMRLGTFFVLLAVAWGVLRGRGSTQLAEKTLSSQWVSRMVAVTVLYLGFLTVVTLLLCFAMRPGYAFIDLLVESASACSNAGLSTGITPSLNLMGQTVIMSAMFIGRLALPALALALATQLRSEPENDLILG